MQEAESYTHPEAELATRPEVGTQAQFRKKKAPKQYKYDSSLAPELRWDGQNPAREEGEALIKQILDANSLEEAKVAAERLAQMSRPFLNWAGKAERLSFDVPTLPLFVHERLSTKAILETLKRHKRDQQTDIFDLFGDPQRSITDQVLRAYEHKDRWVNRLILGDSLVVMNSLLEYEGLGRQVQMIYIDPPYGVKFGSNFQPFIRKRDVKHNDDADMTREPEMVQAYRDTWELGLHSYLAYLRDRLLLAKELLTLSGSVFVQISDDNLHHVRELLDEVFGASNFAAVITYSKTTSTTGDELSVVNDYIVWYYRDASMGPKTHKLYKTKVAGETGATGYTKVMLSDGSIHPRSAFEELPAAARICATDNLTSSKPPGDFPVRFRNTTWRPAKGYWKTSEAGMARLIAANRVYAGKTTLGYVRFLEDFPAYELTNVWTDTVGQNQFGPAGKVYAVQTANIAIQRCMLMATDPGDLVLDPTCGSGTTAYVAEQWGRRWITIDTSRVPLALARQRLLTATLPWYELIEEERGPGGGFAYKRRQNRKGDEVGGVIPHLTLEAIANDQLAAEEILVDRPEIVSTITRVAGPFVVEATIPASVDYDADGSADRGGDTVGEHGSFVERMLEVLRRSPVIQLGAGRTVALRSVRPPARSLSLSAEAFVDASAPGQRPSLADVVDEAEDQRGDRLALSGKPVAIVFGPENGAVSEKLVFNAAREATAKGYTHLYVFGFGIQATARQAIEQSDAAFGIPATYVEATHDLMMGDLLKNLRSSQIFSVHGLPEIDVVREKKRDKSDPDRFVVRLLGVDTFDPVNMEVTSLDGNDVPAWLLDTDYNDLCFHVSQAFFPRTGAWENLRKALRSDYEDSVWEHLNGAESAPFEAEVDRKIAVKVIDPRGNELMVVKTIREAMAK